MNEYKNDKIVNGTSLNKNKDYFSYDLAIKYRLIKSSTIFDTTFFDPFVTLGLGQTIIDHYI